MYPRRIADLLLVLLAFDAHHALAEDPLTALESEANREQLLTLARRTRTLAPRVTNATNVTYFFAGRCGSVGGLASIGQWTGENRFRDPETFLAFSTNPDESRLLRNPSRLPLDSMSISRNPASSDLVDPGDAHELHLYINHTLDATAPPSPVLLYLNNILGPPASSSSLRPGRGLASVVDPTHCKFSSMDLHIFNVLARVARSRAADSLTNTSPTHPTAIVFFGDPTGPGFSTHAEILVWDRATGAELGTLAVSFELNIESGQLTSGLMKVNRARTTIAKEISFAVTRPQPRGQPWDFADPGYEALKINAILPVELTSIDFVELLEGTTWNFR